jgi:hypothetical protein
MDDPFTLSLEHEDVSGRTDGDGPRPQQAGGKNLTLELIRQPAQRPLRGVNEKDAVCVGGNARDAAERRAESRYRRQTLYDGHSLIRFLLRGCIPMDTGYGQNDEDR